MNTFLSALLMLPMAASGADLRIVCFGDSTTAPRKGVVPYCEQIRAAGVETINRGVPSNTTEHGRARFEKDVLAEKPDIVIIQFGINDSAIDTWKKPPAVEPRVSVTRYEENLTYFLRMLKGAGAKVILMTFNPLTWTPKLKELYGTPPYRPDDADGLNEGRAEYLAVVRRLAGEHRVTLLDVDAAYMAYARQPGRGVDDLLLDGIHPNTAGHQLVADGLKRLLPTIR